jgi:hypothetical protein
MCVNLFTKAAKILVKSDQAASAPVQGARLINALEEACEKDKGMSNLKGKIKEIKNIVSNI